MSLTNCRRKSRRFVLTGGTPASVEFEHPGTGGARVIATLRDLSETGLQFLLSSDLTDLEPGLRLPEARIRLAGRAIAGELVVMHVTDAGPGQSACGAMFYPRGERDAETLQELLKQLVGDARDPDLTAAG